MKKRFASLALLIVSVLVLGLTTAQAYDPYNGVKCEGKVNNSAVCHASATNPLAGPDSALAHITNIVAIIAGGVAIIMLLVGSIRYITSSGEPGAVKKAKDTIMYSLIGIAVIVLSRTLIVYVIIKLK